MENMGDKFKKILEEVEAAGEANGERKSYLLQMFDMVRDLAEEHTDLYSKTAIKIVAHTQDVGLISDFEDFGELFSIQVSPSPLLKGEGADRIVKSLFIVNKKETEEEVLCLMLESTLTDITEDSYTLRHDLYEVERKEEAGKNG